VATCGARLRNSSSSSFVHGGTCTCRTSRKLASANWLSGGAPRKSWRNCSPSLRSNVRMDATTRHRSPSAKTSAIRFRNTVSLTPPRVASRASINRNAGSRPGQFRRTSRSGCETPSSRRNASDVSTTRRSTASVTTSSFCSRRYLAAVLRTALFPEPGSPIIRSESVMAAKQTAKVHWREIPISRSPTLVSS
jgi:hypothetical protein